MSPPKRSTTPDVDYLESLGKDKLIAVLLAKQLASSEPMPANDSSAKFEVKAETGAESIGAIGDLSAVAVEPPAEDGNGSLESSAVAAEVPGAVSEQASHATPAPVTNGDLAHCTSDTGICTVPGRGHREPASAQDEQEVEACLPQIEELADQAMNMTEYYKLCGDERSLLTLARRQISMRSWTLH